MLLKHIADSEDPDQTAWARRLIRAIAVQICSRTTFVVCFVVFLTNYRLERSVYVKLKTWMSNSEVPDETAHYEVGWSYKQPFKHYDAIKKMADYSG